MTADEQRIVTIGRYEHAYETATPIETLREQMAEAISLNCPVENLNWVDGQVEAVLAILLGRQS